MAQGIRNQLLYPLWVLLAGMAVMWLLLVEANLSSQKLEIGRRLERLEGAVSKVAIPKTLLVLELMRDMSGAELLLFDGFGRVLLDDSAHPLTTLSTEVLGHENGQPLLETILKAADSNFGDHELLWNSTSYRSRIIPWGPNNSASSASVSVTPDERIPKLSFSNLSQQSIRYEKSPPEGIRVAALIPEQTVIAALWQAARPLMVPLLVGGMVAFTLAVLQGNRIMKRIKGIEIQTKRISQGDFFPMIIPPEKDELRDLAQSVNRMAQQLAEFATRLSENERLKLLGQVGAGLAHQLRNATTGAKLALQLHAKACKNDPEDIEVALKQLDIMERHVGGFLNLGKESIPKREPLHAFQWVKKTVDLTEPIARHSRTSLQWVDPQLDCNRFGELDSGRFDHYGDTSQLEHMLQNLITNALEAAGPGGVVKVGFQSSPMETDIRNLELDIFDNGPGVSPKILEKMFTPFATGKPEGVGLGLAVARQVARSHGGDITHFREEGWTRFHVRLARDPSAKVGQKMVGLDHV